MKKRSAADPFLENHKAEQYFFAESTVEGLADFLEGYENPCCLCTPMVGRRMAERGRRCAVLDSDERFGDVPGFVKYDLYRPTWLDQRFDVILCDPPFFNVSLSQLFKALRELSHHDFAQPLVLAYLSRRADAVLGSLHLFGVRPTGLIPNYRTVQQIDKNLIELYSNVDIEGLTL